MESDSEIMKYSHILNHPQNPSRLTHRQSLMYDVVLRHKAGGIPDLAERQLGALFLRSVVLLILVVSISEIRAERDASFDNTITGTTREDREECCLSYTGA